MITEYINNFPIGLLLFLGLFISLSLLGYFRSAIENNQPDFILDQKKIQDDWLQRNSFTSLFLPVMALSIFMFNLIAWAIYGLISIVDFITLIIKTIWEEFIHPVIFFLIKLVWHYTIKWSWRFFKISFTRIPEAFTLKTLKKGFISVLILSFIFFFFFYLSNILQQQWLLIIMALVFLFAASYFSGYTLYDDENRSFKDYWNNDMMYRLGIMVAICISAVSIILMLNFFYGSAIQLTIFGISFPAMQILIMILIVAFVSSLVSNTILPAYMASTDGMFDTREFLINMVRRLPRLVGSIPFVLFAGAIVSIATIILGSFLWWSTNSIKTNFCENAIDKVDTELYEVTDLYNSVYETVDLETCTDNCSKKTFKKIARLESRLFALDILKKDWAEIYTTLPDGIRNIKQAEKGVDEEILMYTQEEESIAADIETTEQELNELIEKRNRDSEQNDELEKEILKKNQDFNDLKKDLIIHQKQTELFKNLSEARIKSIKKNNIWWVVGTFLGIFGWVLLAAIVLTPFWIYRTKVYFDLYDYYEEGESYFSEQVVFYKKRNENQPLIGIFIAIVLSIIISILNSFIL